MSINVKNSDICMEARNQIHDQYHKIHSVQPGEWTIKKVFSQLPKCVKQLADRLGWDDKEVIERIHLFIEETK